MALEADRATRKGCWDHSPGPPVMFALSLGVWLQKTDPLSPSWGAGGAWRCDQTEQRSEQVGTCCLSQLPWDSILCAGHLQSPECVTEGPQVPKRWIC